MLLTRDRATTLSFCHLPVHGIHGGLEQNNVHLDILFYRSYRWLTSQYLHDTAILEVKHEW